MYSEVYLWIWKSDVISKIVVWAMCGENALYIIYCVFKSNILFSNSFCLEIKKKIVHWFMLKKLID